MLCTGLLAAAAALSAVAAAGGKDCARNGNVHDVTIVIGMNVEFQSDLTDAWAGFLTSMPPERNTATLRQKTVDWLWDNYGLQFDASIAGVQPCTNVAGISLDPRIMDMAALGDNPNRVYAWDDQTGASEALFKKAQRRFPVSNANIVTATYMISADAADVAWTNANAASPHFGKSFLLKAPLFGLYPVEAIVLGTHRVFVDGVAATDESTDIVFHSPTRNPDLSPNMMKEHFFDIGHPVELDLSSGLFGEGGEGYGWSTTRPVDVSNPAGLQFTKNNVVLTWRLNGDDGPADAECKDLKLVGGGGGGPSSDESSDDEEEEELSLADKQEMNDLVGQWVGYFTDIQNAVGADVAVIVEEANAFYIEHATDDFSLDLYADYTQTDQIVYTQTGGDSMAGGAAFAGASIFRIDRTAGPLFGWTQSGDEVVARTTYVVREVTLSDPADVGSAKSFRLNMDEAIYTFKKGADGKWRIKHLEDRPNWQDFAPIP